MKNMPSKAYMTFLKRRAQAMRGQPTSPQHTMKVIKYGLGQSATSQEVQDSISGSRNGSPDNGNLFVVSNVDSNLQVAHGNSSFSITNASGKKYEGQEMINLAALVSSLYSGVDRKKLVFNLGKYTFTFLQKATSATRGFILFPCIIEAVSTGTITSPYEGTDLNPNSAIAAAVTGEYQVEFLKPVPARLILDGNKNWVGSFEFDATRWLNKQSKAYFRSLRDGDVPHLLSLYCLLYAVDNGDTISYDYVGYYSTNEIDQPLR